MNRRTAIKLVGATLPLLYLSKHTRALENWGRAPFRPDWKSLEAYKTPSWFTDAKFGIWAHWGPQCQPERGDWYGQGMYKEGSDQYRYHVETYGHPSTFGFKDVIRAWKADRWDPHALVKLYKHAGAEYFVAMANHHDNFDLFDSTHHRWNSTRLGPRKDLIKGWKAATDEQGLRFGVSVHAAHAWTWYEPAQQADKEGARAGVPYDGTLQKKDGKGTWWEGFDPQELYAQNHPVSRSPQTKKETLEQWDWAEGSGVSTPSVAYAKRFRDRTLQLIDTYDPDLVYFDDTALPLWPVSPVGLEIAAHYYNRSAAKNKGEVDVVITGKILDEQQRQCLVWDIERGQSNRIEEFPWQTCTCIGSWHYDRRIYDEDRYKSAKTIIHMLADVVSKNGNLLLSVPLRGDGSIDDKAQRVVEEIGAWMQVNKEAIVGTTPWHVFGEGPAMAGQAKFDGPGNNEGKGIPFTDKDIRFTKKGPVLYAILLGRPRAQELTIASLGTTRSMHQVVKQVSVLGSTADVRFEQRAEGLVVTLPASALHADNALVLKLT
ncbi:alpha-L-fucosidase [Sphingobacterium suaedae]|uniref:alpha-L-fucosidase n=1 Tax=Sphingobacterium suaedae TaxID=1686402 RepID=A0ABW5KKC3_9SPHI